MSVSVFSEQNIHTDLPTRHVLQPASKTELWQKIDKRKIYDAFKTSFNYRRKSSQIIMKTDKTSCFFFHFFLQ